MTIHAVFWAATGELFSAGDTVADPLPDGLKSRELSSDESARLRSGGPWDAETLTVGEPPVDPTDERIVALDVQIVELKTSDEERDKLAALFKDVDEADKPQSMQEQTKNIEKR